MIDLSPEAFRALGYQAVDMIVDRLTAQAELPVRQPMPADTRNRLMHSPLPTSGADPAELLNLVAELVLSYPMGNSSPRFFAWVNSPPAPMGILAELLAAALIRASRVATMQQLMWSMASLTGSRKFLAFRLKQARF